MFVSRSKRAIISAENFQSLPVVTKTPLTHFVIKVLSEDLFDQAWDLCQNRLNQKGIWPKTFLKAELDCEGITHYLLTGAVGKFETNEANIKNISVNTKHLPYTVYKLWTPVIPACREKMGYWTGRHFFIHIEKGEYLSKNGLGPIRVFRSFQEMLEQDGFPKGFSTKNYTATTNAHEAEIGQSIIGTLDL